jgi:very-short-patch-repair endonuclease
MGRYIEDRRLGRRRGMKKLKAALADRETLGTPESGLERLFIDRAKRSGLPALSRQIRSGARRIDLGYPEAKIAIEVDCLATHFAKEVFEEDRRRQNELVVDGWLPLRFTEAEITDHWPRVRETVSTAYAARTNGSALTG